MPLPNRAQRARVGNTDLLLEQAGRIVQQTQLRFQNGELDVVNRAERTNSDLILLGRQLRQAARGTADQNLANQLQNCSQRISDLATSIQRRTQYMLATGTLQEPQIGFSAGFVVSGTVGRPRIDIRKSQLEFLLSLGFTPTTMARDQIFGQNVHRNTIQNRMREWNLRCTSYSGISDQELDRLVMSLNQQYPHSGYREMTSLLRQRHQVNVPRYRAMQSLQRVDPAGTAGRWACVVSRRTYSATSANSCWHLDTNHALIRWKIIVHGCIDGLSRLIPYLGASDNNKAQTNLIYFLLGVKNFGLPSRVRGDHAGENVHIQRFMEEACGLGRGSFMKGRSVHNSRIERLWRDVFAKVLSKYYNIFSALEDHDLLDPCNDDHLFILHFVFIPRINRDLQEWANVHNQSPLSSCHNKTPLQLWVCDLVRQQGSTSMAIDSFWHRDMHTRGNSVLQEFGLEHWNLEDPESEEPHVIVKPLEVTFSRRQAELLTENCDVLAENSDKPHGLNHYERLFVQVSRLSRAN